MAAAAAATAGAAAAGGGGASLLPPAGPATFAARCVGVVDDEQAQALHNALRGMCVRRSFHEENEYGLVAPLRSGTKQAHLRVIKQVPASAAPLVPLGPPPPIIWRLVHESPPLAGAAYAALPAAVVEASEVSLPGIYSVQFLAAMGCAVRYRIQRRNFVYVCAHEGCEVQVSVYVALNRADDGGGPRPLFEGQAVEARTSAAPERQAEAARRLGRFCQKLLPMVVMKRA